MRFGDAWAEQHDLSSLRLLGSVGEPINPEAWRWYHRGDRPWELPDYGYMVADGNRRLYDSQPTPVVPLKPGSATLPFTGIDAEVVREDGSTCEANEDGYLVIKRPWPGMARTVWGIRTAMWSSIGPSLPSRVGTLPGTAPAAMPTTTSGLIGP